MNYLLRHRPSRFSHGFSLIEILVSLVIAAIATAVALSVLQSTFRGTERNIARGRLAREAQFVHLSLQRALIGMGQGVPRGSRIDDTDNTEIGTSVLIATTKAVGVLGDLTRPHAQYNTFGWLHTESGLDRQHIAFHNENNGACMPGAQMLTSGGACDAEDYSTFFPGDGGNKCLNNGDEGHRLCPWGVRRLEQGDRFLIAAGDGSWTVAEFDFDGNGIDPVGGTAFMEIDTGYRDDAGDWPNNSINAMPVGSGGAGFVTTLDRMFFEIVGNEFRRMQCWGDPDITSANWPPIADIATVPSGLSPASALNFDGSSHECTPEEVLSKNVVDGASSFTFFDKDNNVTTVKEEIRRVDYFILLQSPATAYGDVVQYPIVGSVGFRNLGFATTTTAGGVGVAPPPPPDD